MIEGISQLGFCRIKQAASNIREDGNSNAAMTPSDISEGSQ